MRCCSSKGSVNWSPPKAGAHGCTHAHPNEISNKETKESSLKFIQKHALNTKSKPFCSNTDPLAQLMHYPSWLKHSISTKIITFWFLFNWRKTFFFRYQILPFSAILLNLFWFRRHFMQAVRSQTFCDTQWYYYLVNQFLKFLSKLLPNWNQNILNSDHSLLEAETMKTLCSAKLSDSSQAHSQNWELLLSIAENQIMKGCAIILRKIAFVYYLQNGEKFTFKTKFWKALRQFNLTQNQESIWPMNRVIQNLQCVNCA